LNQIPEPPKIYLNISDSAEICVKAGNKLIIDIPITKEGDAAINAPTALDNTSKRIRGGMLHLHESATLGMDRKFLLKFVRFRNFEKLVISQVSAYYLRV
jgi:hypothetical protein